MAPSDSTGKRPARAKAGAPATVAALLDALDHPRKPEIVALREVILAADPAIAEDVKWNAPSFRTSEYFATVRLTDPVQVVLHFGVRPRPDVAAKRDAFTAVIREWIRHV